jgi:hypothetical protein
MIKLLQIVYLGVVLGLVADSILIVFLDEDIRGVESNVVYTVQNISMNNSLLYQDPNSIPFSVTQYSPNYYLLGDLGVSILNLSPSDPLAFRIMLRVISMLLSIVSALLFYRLCFKLSGNSSTLSLTLTSLLLIFTYPWNFLSRPDALITLCYILVINLQLEYAQSQKNLFPFLLGAVGVVAGLSKLNGLLIIPISVVFFLITRQPKAILILLLGVVTTSIAQVTLYSILGYNLSFIKENIIDGVRNGIDLRNALDKPYTKLIEYHGAFILTTVAFFFGDISKLKPNNWLNRFRLLLLLSVVLSGGFAVLTSLKAGSAINYFNEMLVCLLPFWAIKIDDGSNDRGFYSMRSVLLLIFAITTGANHLMKYVPLHIDMTRNQITSSDKYLDSTISFLSNNLNDDYFFTDQKVIDLSIPTKSVIAQKDVYYTTFEHSILNTDSIKSAFSSGRIRYIVLRGELYPFFDFNPYPFYTLEKEIGPYRIYEFELLP